MPVNWPALAWLGVTVAGYYGLKPLYRRRPCWWTSPLFTVPLLLLILGAALHMDYATYNHDTRWLVLMLGPATVAFALPIWRYRKLMREQWAALAVGVCGGSL